MNRQDRDQLRAEWDRRWDDFMARTDLDQEPEYWEGAIIPAQIRGMNFMQSYIVSELRPVWFDLVREGTLVFKGRVFTYDQSTETPDSSGDLTWRRAPEV